MSQAARRPRPQETDGALRRHRVRVIVRSYKFLTRFTSISGSSAGQPAARYHTSKPYHPHVKERGRERCGSARLRRFAVDRTDFHDAQDRLFPFAAFLASDVVLPGFDVVCNITPACTKQIQDSRQRREDVASVVNVAKYEYDVTVTYIQHLTTLATFATPCRQNDVGHRATFADSAFMQ